MQMKHDAGQQALDIKRAKAGICPECLTDLTNLDPEAHAELEFPEMTLRDNQVSDAHRRKALLLAYARTRPRREQLVHKDPRIALTESIDAEFSKNTNVPAATES